MPSSAEANASTPPVTLDPAAVTTILCDADDNLFPSEAPAFIASTEVTNQFCARLGKAGSFTPEELRHKLMGKNFRAAAHLFATEAGVPVAPSAGRDVVVPMSRPEVEPGSPISAEEMEWWVAEEKMQVSQHLAEQLRPDDAVLGPLGRLARRFSLAAVSSSALQRLAASFTATGLDDLLPPARRWSAEDSPPRPTSKPDPTVYQLACRELGIAPEEAIAVEDSRAGATAAIRAGIPTVGNLQFVTEAERPGRIATFTELGVVAIVADWSELEALTRA